MDDATKQLITTIVAVVITAGASSFATLMLFRGNLAQMANNSFDLAKKATAEVLALTQQVERLTKLFEGRARIVGSYSMSNLARDGYAVLENARIELIEEEQEA